MENNEKVYEPITEAYAPYVREFSQGEESTSQPVKVENIIKTENKPVDPVEKEVEELKKENERRETLRHKVVADFVIMCSEFLYQELLRKLKEQEQKDSFFESMKE